MRAASVARARCSAGSYTAFDEASVSCAMGDIAILRLLVAKHLLPHRRRGLIPPAQPSQRRRTARVLRILHESTVSRYFARPAALASVLWAWNGRASGGILLTLLRD